MTVVTMFTSFYYLIQLFERGYVIGACWEVSDVLDSFVRFTPHVSVFPRILHFHFRFFVCCFPVQPLGQTVRAIDSAARLKFERFAFAAFASAIRHSCIVECRLRLHDTIHFIRTQCEH